MASEFSNLTSHQYGLKALLCPLVECWNPLSSIESRRRFWSDCGDAEVDMTLRWAHVAENTISIALDNIFYCVFIFSPKVWIFSLFLHEHICCGYSSEAPYTMFS